MSKEAMIEAKEKMIELWNKMKTSEIDDAEDDADMFQNSFYVLMEKMKEWIMTFEIIPEDSEAALLVPEIKNIKEALPPPLIVPFDMELDDIIEELKKKGSL